MITNRSRGDLRKRRIHEKRKHCFFGGLSFYSNSFCITGFPFREYFPPYGLLQGIVPDEYTRLSVETCPET